MTTDAEKIRAETVQDNYVKSVETINRIINDARRVAYIYLDLEKEHNDSNKEVATVDIRNINYDKVAMERAAAILIVEFIVGRYIKEGK